MTIERIRQKISDIDKRIIALIAKRQDFAVELAHIKQREGMPIRDEKRRASVLDKAFNYAVEQQIDPVNVQRIFEILLEMSEERQRECSGEGNLP